MPLIEVDDVIASALRDNNVRFTDRTAALAPTNEAAQTLHKMLASAETRPEALRLLKKLNPDAVIPEIDAAAPVNAQIDALRKEFSDYREAVEKERKDAEQRRREAEATDTVSKGRTWLRRDKKLDDEGVTSVEKIMQELGVPNYEVAYNHWAAQQPPAPDPLPQSTIGRNLDWFKAEEDQPDHQLMLKDPIAWRRQEVLKTLQTIRSGQAAA